MTMDRSLKNRGGLKGSRSVLTRAERIVKMQEEDRFHPDTDSPFGLPKMRVRTTKAGSKAKKEEAPAAEGAASAEGAEAAAAPAADAKGAKGAKGAKATAPEAKKGEKKK
ncbi:MAG: small basic protein [Phycisphaerae bacterium]|nr:small basic protein [Phycisphaerae bacterium]